jgi:hypothetical protein
MAARPISDPIHLFDCVMPCAGADAFLVMSEERARDLGLPHAVIRGAIERHNAYADDPVMVQGGWRKDRDDLYAQAGVQPAALDFVQTYDDYPVIVMMQFEDLGFCEKGEGSAFVQSHTMTFDGSFPNNTSGGQLSAGQAGAAGGFLGMVEAIRQLTDQAGERAVPDAQLGLVAGFGMVTYDRCLCTGAVILGDPHDHAPDAPPAQEPGAAHPADEPAARRARPRGARPHGGRSRRPLRAADLRGLRHGAVPAARGLPQVPVRRAALAHAERRGRAAGSTTLHHSNDLFFRERLPWRLGLVHLDAGPTLMVHLHGEVGDAPPHPGARDRASCRRPARPRGPGRSHWFSE